VFPADQQGKFFSLDAGEKLEAQITMTGERKPLSTRIRVENFNHTGVTDGPGSHGQ
jgi:hypothetical protein